MRLLIILFLLFMSPASKAIEEPKYKLIEAQGKFELRGYEPRVVAYVTASGSMKKASNRGFRFVADYIFGNNTSKLVNAENNEQKISMTAPVTVERNQSAWRVSFIMPN